MNEPGSVKQKIWNTVWTLKKYGYRKGSREHVVYAESTLNRISKRLSMLSKIIDLDNPEEVRNFIVRP